MVRGALWGRIEQVVAQKNIRKIDIRCDPTAECFRLHVGILSRVHVPIYAIGSPDCAKTEEGDQYNQNAEADHQHKE